MLVSFVPWLGLQAVPYFCHFQHTWLPTLKPDVIAEFLRLLLEIFNSNTRPLCVDSMACTYTSLWHPQIPVLILCPWDGPIFYYCFQPPALVILPMWPRSLYYVCGCVLGAILIIYGKKHLFLPLGSAWFQCPGLLCPGWPHFCRVPFWDLGPSSL